MSASLRGLRVAVVGAGVVGACIAYQTARAGASVTIVERHHPGAGTTNATFGTIGSLGMTPRPFHELHLRGIDAHERLRSSLGGSWLHQDGALYWESRDDRVRWLEEAVAHDRAWGSGIEPIGAERVRAVEPHVVIPPSATVYRAPRDGWIDCHELACAAVAVAVSDHGARYLRGTVAGLEDDGLLMQDGARLRADVVVNAAGPDASAIARFAGQTLELGHIVGAIVVTEPAPIRLRHVLKTTETRMHPDLAGRVVLYGEHFGPQHQDRATRDRVGADAIAAAAVVVPSLGDVQADSVRAGVRAEPLDGSPILGRRAGSDLLYHAVTRSGVALGPLIGELVAADLAGSGPPLVHGIALADRA